MDNASLQDEKTVILLYHWSYIFCATKATAQRIDELTTCLNTYSEQMQVGHKSEAKYHHATEIT
jgi:hypothetical protein